MTTFFKKFELRKLPIKIPLETNDSSYNENTNEGMVKQPEVQWNNSEETIKINMTEGSGDEWNDTASLETNDFATNENTKNETLKELDVQWNNAVNLEETIMDDMGQGSADNWNDIASIAETYPSFHENIFEKDVVKTPEKNSLLSSITRSVVKSNTRSSTTKSMISNNSGKFSQKILDSGLNPLLYNDEDCPTQNFGLTVVDVAELLLHRGAKGIKNGLFHEAFNNYNAAYKLLFEIKEKRAEIEPEEMNSIKNSISTDEISNAKIISTQLHGLTQRILLDNIEKLYSLLNVEVCREEADLCFAMKKYNEAIVKYDEALNLIPMHVGCLSNRAACKLAMEDFLGCVQDSTTAFRFLDVQISPMDPFFENNGIDILTCVVPSLGTLKRLELTVKTVIRRGAAYVRLDQLQKAVVDYRTATSLDPKNMVLQNDLKMLVKHRDDQIRLFTKRG